jgi:MFS family permease
MASSDVSRSESQPLLRDPQPEPYSSATAGGEHEGQSPTKDSDTQPRVSVPHRKWTFTALWSIVFLGALDGTLGHSKIFRHVLISDDSYTGTITATMITPIGSYFKQSNEASYIGTAYLLSVCCFTPLYGRLADILGRRGALLLALTLFGLFLFCHIFRYVTHVYFYFIASGTILCGLAPSLSFLIAARALAGMGGGG